MPLDECRMLLTRNITYLVVAVSVLVVAYIVLAFAFAMDPPLILLSFLAGAGGGLLGTHSRLHKMEEGRLRVVASSFLSTALLALRGGLFAVTLYVSCGAWKGRAPER